MAAGRLDVLLGLDAAEFTSGLTKAEYEAAKFQKKVVQLGSQIGKALGAGFVAAAGATALLTKSAIDAQDKLLDLSIATGVTVENLGGIGFAAKQAGSDLESVASSFGKLNVKIAEAARGEKDASEAFKALGVAVKDAAGNTRSADAIFKDVATSFQQFADGPEKAALGMAIFGKSYQQMLPLLNDGGKALQENIDYFNKYAGVTTETAQKSSIFNDTLGKLGVQADALGNALVRELIGPLQTVADEMLRTAEQTTILNDAAALARDTFVFFVDKIANATTNLKIAGIVIAEFAAKVKAITEGALPGSTRFDAISKAAREDVDRALKELDRFKGALQNAAAPPVKGIGLESLDAMFKGKPEIGSRPAPRLSGPAAPKQKEAIDENTQAFARYVEQLDSAINKGNEYTKVQEVTLAIEQNRFGQLIPQQKELLLLLAKQADAADEYSERIKFNAEQERESMRILTERQAIIDRFSSSNKKNADSKTLEVLASEIGGSISIIDYDLAKAGFEGIKDEIKETTSAAEELGLVFTSAIGDFIKDPTQGKSFFKALIEDVLQLTTQLLILKPLAEGMTEIFGGAKASSAGGKQIAGIGDFFSSIFGGLVGSFARGTDFVPADGLAMVHRGERIVPAAENKKGSRSVVINQTFSGPQSTQTMAQANAQLIRSLNADNVRYN